MGHAVAGQHAFKLNDNKLVVFDAVELREHIVGFDFSDFLLDGRGIVVMNQNHIGLTGKDLLIADGDPCFFGKISKQVLRPPC